ncbi:hypothetical protein XELAEV_18012227mg [Xenopus laevis]|uniref:Uncharacterized protein n=1 Tax=Xenopus laevis TaxID=8355 RepID=A0A974DM84_XENLA|nr:hypothetical protein XELAEV_18012227mg [Xenopus laevis]
MPSKLWFPIPSSCIMWNNCTYLPHKSATYISTKNKLFLHSKFPELIFHQVSSHYQPRPTHHYTVGPHTVS